MTKILGLLSGSLYLGLVGFSYADTTLRDADFLYNGSLSTYNGSLSTENLGDITIETTSAVTPVVNGTVGGYALNADVNHHVILKNANPITIIGNNTPMALRSVADFDAYGDVEVKFENTGPSRGVYAVDKTNANFHKNLTVTSASNGAIGVEIYSSAHLTMTNSDSTLKIQLTGDKARGLVAQTEQPDAKQFFVSTSKVVINLSGNNTVGILTTSAPQGEEGKSQLTFNKDVSVTTDNGTVLFSNLEKGELNFEKKSTFISKDFMNYNAIVNYKGTINITGDTDIQGDMYLTGATSHTNINAKMNIVGGIDVASQADLSMNALEGSLIKGEINSDSTARTTLSLKEGAEWDVRGNSKFQTLDNNGQVRFIDNGGGAFTTLNVDTLSGGGTFVMNADIAGQTGDKIIAATTSGAHLVRVVNNGSISTTGTEAFDMIETGDGKATFTGTNKVELGGYEYQLGRSATNPNNWGLYGGKVPQKEPPTPQPPAPEPPTPQPPLPEITIPQTEPTVTQTNSGKITTTANAAASFASAGYLMSYVDNQMLMTRMGELRNNPNSAQGNFWVRGFGGKMNAFSVGKIAGFDMSYGGTQFGLDKAVDTSKGIFYGGAALSYISGNPDYWGGDANYKSYQASLYATYLADTGYYIDGILKYRHQKNEFDVRDSAGNKVSGDASSDGWGVSVEVGKRIILKDERFYIEPQLQLSYSSLGSYDSHASNGLYIKADDTTSLLGRIGGTVGYKLDQVRSPTHLYVNAYYVHEFDGDVDYRLNGSHEGHSFEGDWGDFAVGFNTQILKQHNLYSEVHYETGGNFDDTRFNLGYRFQF